MNQHNPPTESEVRASLWKRNQQLEGRLTDRTQQRDDLMQSCQELIDSAWYPGKEREPIIDRAKRTLQLVREEIETE